VAPDFEKNYNCSVKFSTFLLEKVPASKNNSDKVHISFCKKKMKNVATSFSCFAVEAHLNGDNPR